MASLSKKMYFDDHLPPRFHTKYGEFEGVIYINTLVIIAGELPSRALGLTIEWASVHQDELKDLWEKARNNKKLDKLDPLD